MAVRALTTVSDMSRDKRGNWAGGRMHASCPRKAYHSDVLVVLGSGANHGRAADVNVLNSHLRSWERSHCSGHKHRCRGRSFNHGAATAAAATAACADCSPQSSCSAALCKSKQPAQPTVTFRTRAHLVRGLVGGGDGLAEGVQVDHHNVNGLDVVLQQGQRRGGDRVACQRAIWSRIDQRR